MIMIILYMIVAADPRRMILRNIPHGSNGAEIHIDIVAVSASRLININESSIDFKKTQPLISLPGRMFGFTTFKISVYTSLYKFALNYLDSRDKNSQYILDCNWTQ